MPILASANRDESKFEDPETFDIDRKIEFPLMSFGQGPHFCLGNYLSRMEARAALEVAFSRFDVLEPRSEEHTSELQSLMRISYAVFCLKKKKTNSKTQNTAKYSKH